MYNPNVMLILYCVSCRNMEDETDNPFRPGSELSREADIIVNLIKEGKPITPTRDMDSANDLTNGSLTKQHRVHPESSPSPISVNGSPAKVEPGVVDVQHGIIVPSTDKLQVVEQVNLKKKRKCCTIQ